MELRIRPALQNSFPLAGFYIRGASLHHWLFEIQSLGLAATRRPPHPQNAPSLALAFAPIPICPHSPTVAQYATSFPWSRESEDPLGRFLEVREEVRRHALIHPRSEHGGRVRSGGH